MHHANSSRAILAGFIATLVMTMIMYAAPMMGMPKMDIAGMLGSLFNGMEAPPAMSALWWTGMIIHFVDGTILFPLVYAYFLYGLFTGSPWLRGATFAGRGHAHDGSGRFQHQYAGAGTDGDGQPDRPLDLRSNPWGNGWGAG
jgi:hypothetical protein